MTIATPWDGNPDPPDGIWSGVPFVDYRAFPNRTSQSTVKQLIIKTPGQAKWDWDHPKETSIEMILGDAIDHVLYREGPPDSLVLPPKSLVDEFKGPHGWRSSKKGKAWITEQTAAGRTLVTENQLASVLRAADAVLAHPLARRLLEAGEHQIAALWTCPDWRLRRRGLLDTAIPPGHGLSSRLMPLPDESGLVVDLKSTGAGNAEQSAWGRQAGRMLYDFQLADYKDGLELLTGQYWDVGIHIVVEMMTELPRVEVHRMGDAELERGRDDRRRKGGAIETYMACKETGIWPTSTTATTGMGTTKFPPWEMNR